MGENLHIQEVSVKGNLRRPPTQLRRFKRKINNNNNNNNKEVRVDGTFRCAVLKCRRCSIFGDHHGEPLMHLF